VKPLKTCPQIMIRIPASFFAALAALALYSGEAAADSVEELLQEGDAFDQRYQAAEALKFYLPAEQLEPKNPLILVRIARQYRHLASDIPSKEEKLRLGGIALEYSKRAAALAPDDAEAQLSVAISYGKMLPNQGAKAQVQASPRIKEAVDKALKLDPQNDLAWHVLGRWHRVLADVTGVKRILAGAIYGKLPSTTNEAAAKCLQKAIALRPTRLMHYIELGRVYAQMGRKEEARRLINKGLAMPNVEKDDPEMKRLGREALEKLK
jgi:tetratricopeptide (TPR) repeat protein